MQTFECRPTLCVPGDRLEREEVLKLKGVKIQSDQSNTGKEIPSACHLARDTSYHAPSARRMIIEQVSHRLFSFTYNLTSTEADARHSGFLAQHSGFLIFGSLLSRDHSTPEAEVHHIIFSGNMCPDCAILDNNKIGNEY